MAKNKKTSLGLAKNISIPVLVIVGFILMTIGVGAYFAMKNEAVLNNPFAIPSPTTIPTETPTPTPTSTPVPTKIPIPTKPKVTNTPAVSPTPGELGFEVPDKAYAKLVKGECAPAITVKSKTSTSYRLDITRDSSQPRSMWNSVTWKNPDNITVEKGTSSEQWLCTDPNIVVCDNDGYGCTSGKFYDNTTGAVKGIQVCLTVKCSP